MDVRHPRALDEVAGHPPSAVSIDRSRYAVADDGTVTLPSEYEADRLASAYGVDVSEIACNQQSDDVLVNDDEAEPETIGDAIDDGVCPWCDDYEGDHVGQHASSAHPEDWDAYSD